MWIDTFWKWCNKWKKTMVKILTHPLLISIHRYGLPQQSSISMIIVVFLRVDHNCKDTYKRLLILLFSLYRPHRLVKEVCRRMLESSSSPYDTFINNSIQLVHVAKVRNQWPFARISTLSILYFRLTWKHSWCEHFMNKWPKPLNIHQLAQFLSNSSVCLPFIHYAMNQQISFKYVSQYVSKSLHLCLVWQLKLLSADQIYELETHVLPDLYTRLRPNLVALVDAFDFHDHELSKSDIVSCNWKNLSIE